MGATSIGTAAGVLIFAVDLTARRELKPTVSIDTTTACAFAKRA